MTLKSVIRFVCCCLLTTFASSVLRGCGLNETISTYVDGGVAVHGVIRVDFCRGHFWLPAFLCLLLWPCNYCIAVLVDFYKIAVIVMAYTVNNMKVTFPSVLLNNLHDLCFPHLHAVDIVGQLL